MSVWHGGPYHPQTQGKEERFHRTLKLEVIGRRPVWSGLGEVQVAFDGWRSHYNLERPHESLAYASPVSRYAPSPRAFPRLLPPLEYEEEWPVRKVMDNGRIKFRGESYFVGKAFTGEPVGLRQVGDAVWDVYYCHQPITQVDLSLSVEVEDV